MLNVLLASAILFLPLLAAASGISAAMQQSAFESDLLADPGGPQFIYGALTGFPHTFQFEIAEPTQMTATLATADSERTDLSLILVREVERGVVEVERQNGSEVMWQSGFHWLLGKTLFEMPPLRASLSPGSYRMEVSAPANLGVYELQLNNPNEKVGLGTKIRRVFAVHHWLGFGFVGAVFSPVVYVPVLAFAAWLLWRRLSRRNLYA